MTEELDEIDKRILYELDLNCRIPELRLARVVGRSKESVRYRMNKLREKGILKGFGTYVDLTQAGLWAHKLYLRTREKPGLQRSFLAHVRSRPDVFWLGVGDGAWNIGLTFFTSSLSDFFKDKNGVFSRFRELVIAESVGTVVEDWAIGKKFLRPDSKPPAPSRVFGQTDGQRLDSRDLQILRCLIADGRMPYSAIAARTRLPPGLVRSRIKDMERSRIITRYSAHIDYEKLGMEFYKTFLHFEGLTPQHEKRLFELAVRHPNVVNFLKVLAPWDVELEVMADNYHSYNQVINYFREEFSDVLTGVQTTVQSVDEIYPSGRLPLLAGP